MSPAAARGQLQAGPTQLEIGAGGGATRLVLRNTGDAAVAAQVRTYAWRQVDGEDRLTPSDLLVASPPIIELPAGAEQVVRVVLVGPPAMGRDQTYRVVVDELPNNESSDDSRIALRMRYVIPAFVRADDASPAALSCTIDASRARLACRNDGGRPVQLGASRLIDRDGGTVELSSGLYGYVLPDSLKAWPLPTDRPELIGGASQLETRLDGRLITLDIERGR